MHELGLTYFEHSIVAASLQPQLYALLRSEKCGSVDSAYYTGLVEAIFAFGSLAGMSSACLNWLGSLRLTTITQASSGDGLVIDEDVNR